MGFSRSNLKSGRILINPDSPSTQEPFQSSDFRGCPFFIVTPGHNLNILIMRPVQGRKGRWTCVDRFLFSLHVPSPYLCGPFRQPTTAHHRKRWSGTLLLLAFTAIQSVPRTPPVQKILFLIRAADHRVVAYFGSPLISSSRGETWRASCCLLIKGPRTAADVSL